ncbi:MAG TPA: xanthine dehydrogenase accessory protein XdhC [Phycisphaerae bacterium]|nr:xanthine dehydrogenase accessory protein XdhC [Phycisphaerae bacterium]
MSTYWENLQQLLADGRPFVSVTLVDIIASAPQNIGAKMLVTSDGLLSGTVGGGKIEARAIAEAQQLLADRAANRFVEWNLQTDIGMTCGGVVKLFFETYNVATWPIVIFGAGHCSQALVRLLLTLQCHITVIDIRDEWLQKLPRDERLTIIKADQPMPTYVATLPANAFVLCMTMGHSSDLPVLIEILRTRDFPFLGAIGSDAKAAALRRGIRDAGLPEESARKFFCPIGLDLGSNDPSEIAISIAAQLLQQRDAVAPPNQNDLNTPSPPSP